MPYLQVKVYPILQRLIHWVCELWHICRLLLADKNARTTGELQTIRAFKTAAQKMLANENRLVAPTYT